MPEQFADEQAVAAAEHEQVQRPFEPRPRGEQGGMGEPLVVNRLVVGVELKVAAKVEPEPSRASLQDQRGVRGHRVILSRQFRSSPIRWLCVEKNTYAANR